MSLNETVSAERTHIAFFGKRNAGKSSLVNSITGQNLSVVSDVLGTTTDPVKKAMEILPIGPCVIIDTPGFDDEGALGDLRVKKTKEILAKTDIAVLVTEGVNLDEDEQGFLDVVKEKELPFIIAHNKADILNVVPGSDENEIWVSSKENTGIEEFKKALASLSRDTKNNKKIVSDLLNENDVVILVTPIDESAPKGRIILPQQQTLRDILDSHCTAIVCQPDELDGILGTLKKLPKMVICDSQVFGEVSNVVPKNVPLTSFSILFARYKGGLAMQVRGIATLSKLCDGDKVLIAEGCTHHRQCNDIGTVKMPAWIKKASGVKPEFVFTSGGEFPENLEEFKLIVHCGACMLNEAEMKNRMKKANEQNVPVVNYGVAIAYMNGILKKSLELFPDLLKMLE